MYQEAGLRCSWLTNRQFVTVMQAVGSVFVLTSNAKSRHAPRKTHLGKEAKNDSKNTPSLLAHFRFCLNKHLEHTRLCSGVNVNWHAHHLVCSSNAVPSTFRPQWGGGGPPVSPDGDHWRGGSYLWFLPLYNRTGSSDSLKRYFYPGATSGGPLWSSCPCSTGQGSWIIYLRTSPSQSWPSQRANSSPFRNCLSSANLEVAGIWGGRGHVWPHGSER